MQFMWKRKEDEKPVAAPTPPPTPVVPKEVRPMETPKTVDSYRAEVAHIGKSVLVKGELSGSEDLYLDGEVEGSIELRGHSLTVGPNGRVRANIHARDVTVHGKVDGNIRGSERVELKRSAQVVGDITTQRVVIEDGAFFKGGIDIQREGAKAEGKAAETRAAASTAAAAGVSAPSASAPASMASASPAGYSSALDKK
jgi:cytoskeletal protein CcmA (bactofilin family)